MFLRLASPLAIAAATLSLSACVIVVDAGSGEMIEPTSFTQQAVPPADANVDDFDAVKAASGASVVIRSGTEFRVVLDEDAVNTGAYEIDGGSLVIECRRPCRGGMKGQATVYAPRIAHLRASSGGGIDVEDGVQSADTLTLRASSGGSIDARALAAERVEANASSGGSIVTSVSARLQAEASSGGSIRYVGDPEVSANTSSGGSIRKSGGA